MFSNNTNRWDNAQQRYFFYVFLAIILGMAVFGIVSDITARF